MMTGLGYYGSSSSSNLSPLAPPFTVNRSNNNNPVLNSNPASYFNDPSYAVPFTSSGQEFFGDSSRTTNDYGLIVSEPFVNSHNLSGLSSNGTGRITPARSHWSTVNPSQNRVADSLFNNLRETKAFQPYASSVKNDDIPLVSFSEASSDIFSACGVVRSDEIDYTRTLSGLQYNPKPKPNPNPNPNPHPKQEGISSLSLHKEKPVGKMEKDGSFFLQEGNTTASFAYNNYLNQGAYCTETLSEGKDGKLYYADIIRKANNGKSDGTSSFANNHGLLDSNELPIEESHFRAFPAFSESNSSLIQSSEDPFWNSQKLTPSYEKRYRHMVEDGHFKSTTKSSPIVIKSPAAAVTAISASSKSSNISDVVVSTSHNFLKEKEELKLPQLGFQMGKTNADCFSIKGTKLLPVNDQPNFEFKAMPSVLQVPDINIPDAANSFDLHNPAEDSPCWKGTPSLPFGSPETQPSAKKLQKGTKIQGIDYSYNNHSSDGETSSNPSPFHTDTGDVVESLKARDGGDDAIKPDKGHDCDANSQIPKPNLPNAEEVAILLAEMYGEAADKKVNASVVVKAIYNLSDVLLQVCSIEGLKEHDHEALDHVTRNLGMCMSRRVHVAATSTSQLIMPHSNTSQESQVINETNGTYPDDEQHAHYQKMKSNIFGESLKNSLEHSSLRNLDPPKGNNMVEAIKKVLEENLECEVELPSETSLLYKNLWLEAEAELCCLNSRTRFERLKGETQKEKPQKSTATGDASSIKETLRSCNVSAFLKDDTIRVSNAQHTDDVVNLHVEHNPVKEGVTGSGATVLHQLCKDDDDDDHDNNGVDSWVIARLNILKNREESNTIDQEAASAAVGSGSDWEHILKDEFSW